MEKLKVTVEETLPGVYCLEEGDGHYINAYLIVGEDSAILVDTLCQDRELYRRVREITQLPLTVLITHGHGDHAGASTVDFRENGCPVWMAPQDVELLGRFGGEYPEGFFLPLADGMEFQAGGITLRTVLVPGHTPGSAVFLCEDRQWMFSGDTVGSGAFWMQIPGCVPLSVLAVGLRELYGQVRSMPELRLFTGHRYQAPHALGLPYVKDVLDLTEEIVSGALVGEEASMQRPDGVLTYRVVSRGDMSSYCYDPARICER